jgi:clan AA aspartic protease (TIGR02281 family)
MTFAVERKAVRLSAAVNGIPVRFLVDTGATMVAFPRAAAGKLGVDLNSSSVRSTASTADGTKYPITLFWLKRLEIGSCVLNNVEAMLVGRPMPEPLLGMSALLRMNVEMGNGKMSLSCPVDPARPVVPAPSRENRADDLEASTGSGNAGSLLELGLRSSGPDALRCVGQ